MAVEPSGKGKIKQWGRGTHTPPTSLCKSPAFHSASKKHEETLVICLQARSRGKSHRFIDRQQKAEKQDPFPGTFPSALEATEVSLLII